MKWYNTEVTKGESEKLKRFLQWNGIKHETSGCYGKVHFEILCTENQATEINEYLDNMEV